MKTVCVCEHCGDQKVMGGFSEAKCARMCETCRTAAGRKKVHEENKAISGTYACGPCSHDKNKPEVEGEGDGGEGED